MATIEQAIAANREQIESESGQEAWFVGLGYIGGPLTVSWSAPRDQNDFTPTAGPDECIVFSPDGPELCGVNPPADMAAITRDIARGS